jgi:protein SCO1
VERRRLALLFTAALLSLAAVVVAVIGVVRTTGSSAEPASTPIVDAPDSPFEGARLPDRVRAPNFALRDEEGRRVTMREYRGEPVIVTFLYSDCTTECPAQAQQIKGALDQLGHDVPALAISVNPPGDTPKSIRRFNAKMGVSGRIRWVRGTEDELRRLWKGFAIVPQTPQQEHLARIVLVDSDGIQRVGFPASQVTPERLAHDLRLLERES